MIKQLKNANTNQDVFPELEDRQVSTSKISDGAITEDKMASDSVSTDKIVDGAITSAKIGANAITTPKIQSESITGDKIVNEAINYRKLNFGIYIHHIIFDVVVNSIAYTFTFDIISKRNTAYDRETLEAYLGVHYGSDVPFGWLVNGEGFCYISNDGNLAVNIHSYKGDKLNPAIELNNVSLADNFVIVPYTPIFFFTAV